MFDINNKDNCDYFINNLNGAVQNDSLVNGSRIQPDIVPARQLEVKQLHAKTKETSVETLREFSEYKQLETARFTDKELVQLALQLICDAVIITDASGCVLFLNLVAEKLTGWRLQEAQTLPLSAVFKIINETTSDILDNPIKQVLHENRFVNGVNHALLIAQDNSLFSIEHSATPIRDCNDQIIGAILVFRDVSKSRKLARELSWQVSHDSLTGLVNRFSFEQYLEDAVFSASTLVQQHVLCYLDLDLFKIINDTCGHVAGNELLRQVSALLQKRVRKTDILARLGSDEFGLILYQCNLEQALNVVKILREEVQKFRFIWKDKTFNLSISIGVVMLNAESESSSSMLSAAESACYVAKSKGRNRVHIYQPNDLDVANQRGEIQWVTRIFRALEEDLFLLYCQPIIPLEPTLHIGRTIRGSSYEVLLRLQDEAGKIVLPGDFIPAAERYGLMHLIDRWVIRTLFARLGKNNCKSEKPFQEQHHNCLYTINLSGNSLNDDQFLDFVQEQFVLHSVPPQIICFEITETVAISNLNKATQFIHQLKAIGCCFALDDFGSGMSSFGYLKSLPVDYLKIDGIFIKDIFQSGLDCEIVEAINRIAHVMKIQTVAECVESNEILMKLKTLGIDYAQGYGIAKPGPLSLS